MGDVSYPFQGFGKGLNLRDKPDTVDPAECIDALNVLFSDRGAIQQRPGYGNLTGSALTNRVGSLEPFYTTAGTKQLLAGCGTRLEGLSSGGAVVASATGLTNAVWDFARFGQPNAEVAYAGNGQDTLRKWNGSEWSAPTATVDGVALKAMPKAGSLCVSPIDNRLVCGAFGTTTGGPNGVTSSPSHVFESEAGNPEAFESTAFVQYTPGDGERIMAVIAWKEFVFIFKETKFFVRYGTSTDSEGKPIFNYRPVEAGVGLASSRAVCIHPSGVYFMSRHGVYRTTGQEPEEVSQIIEPIWTGQASPFFSGGTLTQGSVTECAMATHEDRIYLSYPISGGKFRTLVYDPQLDWWSLFDISASCFASFRPENTPELVFGYATGEKHVGRHASNFTSDEGVAISSSWRSGWFDLGIPDVKTIRSSKVWGTGIVQMGLDYDFNVLTGPAVELNMDGTTGSLFGGEGTFGGEGIFGDTATDLIGVPRRVAVRGTVFSVALTASTLDLPWSLHRISHHLRESRKPATVAA